MKTIFVDGFWVRSVFGDMNFSLLGRTPDWDSHWYVPPGEIWIEERSRKEARFLIRSDCLEHALDRKTGDYLKARRLLNRKLNRKTKKNISVGTFKKNGLTIRIVNGPLVRQSIDYGFIMGGHHYVYPRYIPEGEIWLDSAVKPEERKYILVHESTERGLMKKGWPYDKAHDIGCVEEEKSRIKGGASFHPAKNSVAPLSFITFGKNRKKRILIDSGIHGEEPSGPLIIGRLMMDKKFVRSAGKKFSFDILPLINPEGIAHGIRGNGKYPDLNRWFFDHPKADEPWEVRNVRGFIERRKYDFVISLHEDCNRRQEIYLYDHGNGEQSAMIKGIFRTTAGFGLKKFDGLDDSELGNYVKNGYVPIPEGDPFPGFDEYLARHGKAKKLVCTELPGKMPLEKKIQAGVAIVKEILKNI